MIELASPRGVMPRRIEPISRGEHRCLLLTVGAYIVTLVVLTSCVHPAGVIGEPDDYAQRGADLLSGELGGDRYHPFLYPELIALLFAIIGDAATAARAVSSAFAGLLLYSTYRFGRELFGRRPAIAAGILLACNAQVVLFAIRAAADIPAASLFVTSIWVMVAANGRRRMLVVAGVFLGLASSTRLNFVPLIAVLSGAVLVVTKQQRWRSMLAFSIGALIGLLPHAVPSTIAFGAPLASDSWRNIAFKLTGDVLALEAPPYAGMLDMLAADWARILDLAWKDFVAMWTSLLGEAMAGSHAVAPTATAMTLLLLLALVWWVGTTPWRHTLAPLVAAVSFTAFTAATFWAHIRLLLPVQALAIVWVTGALFAVARRVPWLTPLGFAALLAGVLSSVAPTLRVFSDSVPVQEIEAARQLSRREGPLIAIASFHGPMHREVPARIVYVPQLPYGQKPASAYMERAMKRLADQPVDYLVLGPKTCGGVSTDALRAAAPAHAAVELHDAAVLVLRLPRSQIDWLERATATVADGKLVLTVEVKPAAAVLLAGFTVYPSAGDAIVLPLDRVGQCNFQASMLAPEGSELWSFAPSCVLATGEMLLGGRIRATVR